MRLVPYLLLIAALPAAGADRWLRLTTPDFELYTQVHNQNGEKEGKDTMLRFEQVRAFFLKASPVRQGSEFPVRIVEFDSPKDYERYRVSEAAAAWFTETPARDYIVTGPAAKDNFGIAIHEYMHLVVRHSGLKLPLWLNEGWADVYSTLRPLGHEAAIGDLLDDRMKVLERSPWLTFDRLTSVNQRSPEYNEADRVGIFYAESWGLTHMLYFAPDYEAGFGKFVTALNQGHSAAEACQLAWNRSSAQVFADLRTYFDRRRIVGRAYAVQLEKMQGEPAVFFVSDFEQRLMLADILAARRRYSEAAQEYAELAREQPDNPAVATSRGFLALQTGDAGGVLRNFDRALVEGETDPRMYYAFAVFLHATNRPAATVRTLLRKALQAKPDYTGAQVLLGLVEVESGDFAAAIATLMAIPKVEPEQAPVVFCSLAEAYSKTNDPAAAARNLEICRKWARTPAQLTKVEQLTSLLNAR